jgi:putrescine aminotransferase
LPGIIGEVRGKGLMIGVELLEERFGGSVIMEMAKRRVIGVYTLNKPKVIRFEPPLIIKGSRWMNVSRHSGNQ